MLRLVLKSRLFGLFTATVIPQRIPNYHLHKMVCDQGIYSHFQLCRNEMRSHHYLQGTTQCIPEANMNDIWFRHFDWSTIMQLSILLSNQEFIILKPRCPSCLLIHDLPFTFQIYYPIVWLLNPFWCLQFMSCSWSLGCVGLVRLFY